MTKNKSVFLEVFGNKTAVRIIDFLLEHRLQDYSEEEIKKELKLSPFPTGLKILKVYGILKPTGERKGVEMLQLNEGFPIVKKIKELEMELIKIGNYVN
jgi:hypothetical protein